MLLHALAADSGSVACGNLFLEGDIGGGKKVPPAVVFQEAKADSYYTLLMVDPDADMNGSFPEATAPGAHAPVRHWVVGNIKGSELATGDLSKALTISPFVGPSPPAGSHRYGQFVFEQPGKLQFDVYPANASIVQWDYAKFITTYGLGQPVASNWHVTQHTD